jgi:hypothetical protein
MTVRSTLILASGMAKPTGSGTYVSDLACRNRAGITVTLSRGFSPHSAAGCCFRSPAHRPFFQLSTGSITQKSPNCKEIPGHSNPRLSILRYLGLSLGVLFGLTDNIGLGMMIGVDVGLCGGSAVGTPKGKKEETSDEEKENGEK